MSYVSLYRKYRSQTFEDVIGQEHVTRTLQNAIRLGKVAHAYLFCGTRGTGKTTTARLLAKSLNCDKGPTPHPCNECPACMSIAQGTAMDLIELDAASHRGVKDIEEIRDNVKFPPMELRYKVFIIDEAHQLSNDAKDAFLKTLEEPPAHAVFILATTEPQSIPITIRSRCQQFDFRRGSLRHIGDRLKSVIEGESIEAEQAALDLIAVNADGSYRDSLSLLEQVLAYTEGRIIIDDVNTVLGTVTQDFLYKLVDIFAEGDHKKAFEASSEAVESGKDVQQLLKSTARHIRDLLFASVSNDLGEITASEETADKLRKQAGKFERTKLLRIVEILTEAERDIRYTDQHRLILELALLKAMDAVHSPQVEAVPAPAAKPEKSTPQPPAQERKKSVPKAEPQPERAAEVSGVPAAPPQQNLPEFDKISEKWGQVLEVLKTVDPLTRGLMKDVTLGGLENGSLVLLFKYEGHINMLEGKPAQNTKRKALLQAITRIFGVSDPKIICRLDQVKKQPAPPVEPEEDDLPNPFEENSRDTLKDMLDVFPNAKIVDD